MALCLNEASVIASKQVASTEEKDAEAENVDPPGWKSDKGDFRIYRRSIIG